MAKTIVFKPEFEAKLKQLKIKTKFIKRLKEYKSTISSDFINELNNRKSWKLFIDGAFTWKYEELDFWYNIANS